jgi:hypothetical protein
VRASALWAEPKRGGGDGDSGYTPYGTQPTVGEEPLCGLGCVRLGYGMFGFVMLGWVR